MIIPLEWMPIEFWRHTKLFFKAFQSDSDIRHAETRLRLALELRASIPENDIALFTNILERFQHAKKRISFLDLPLLMEWTERKELATWISRIYKCKPENFKADPFTQACVDRLQNIADEMRRAVPPTDPEFWSLIVHRWHFAALRDEANYLLDRLSCLCLANSSSNS